MLRPMPGQRKRKRQQEAQRRRAAAAYEGRDGRWEVVFSTQDEGEWGAFRRGFRRGFMAEHPGIDPESVRVDMFCGRLVQPTTYRLSVFVPETKVKLGGGA